MEKWKSLDRCNVLDETEKDDNCRIYKDELIDNLSDSTDLSKFCDKLVQRYNVDLSHLPWETQYSYLRGKSLYVLPESQLKQQLVDSKVKWKPLVVKFWIDPTWSDIHLWHTVPIIMLNRFHMIFYCPKFLLSKFHMIFCRPKFLLSKFHRNFLSRCIIDFFVFCRKFLSIT